MIYVTVGGVSSYGFLRLVRKMDDLAPLVAREVVMQIGDTRYEPSHARWFRYNTYQESMALFREADLVISHCSTGTALTAKMARQDRPTIVVPRRKKYVEHFDDHQMELALLLEKQGTLTPIYVVYEVDDLDRAIPELLSAKHDGPRQGASAVNPLVEYLKSYVS